MSSGYYAGFTPGGTQYGSGAGSYATYGVQPAAPNVANAQQFSMAYGAQQQSFGFSAQSGPSAPSPASVGQSYSSYGAPGVSKAPNFGANNPAIFYGAGQAASGGYGNMQQPGQSVSSTSDGSGPTTYSGYDAALYAAAKTYLAAKNVGQGSEWMNAKVASYGVPGGGQSFASSGSKWGRGGGRGSFPMKRGAGPRTQAPTQTHYCEVCKISCGGVQAYREHLEGKMHKKKEALSKSGPVNPAKTKNSFYCAVCEIMCTGADTYQSHVRGAKHQKTLNLFRQMGKPLPAEDATVLPPLSAVDSAPKKVVVVQKTNFLGGETLHTTGNMDITKSIGPQIESLSATLPIKDDIQPVGEDYLEVVKIEGGKVTAYNCKLCDCRFTDLNAKDMHMKGRRHRMNYKKKVNPDLEVEVKSSANPRLRRVQEDKVRRDLMKMRQQDVYTMRAMYQTHLSVPSAFGNIAKRQISKPVRSTVDDRNVMTKHNALCPTDEENNATITLVAETEKALKSISDHYDAIGRSNKFKQNSAVTADGGDADERLLKGVMRVGDLAKQLMLKGDNRVDLIVICSQWPSRTLLNEIAGLLPQKFVNTYAERCEVSVSVDDCCIIVKTKEQPCFELHVILTSVVVRDNELNGQTPQENTVDALDKNKCLAALAELRQTKWFQARCANLQFCLVVLRILKDIRQRYHAWSPLSQWATDLLVEKVLNSNSIHPQPSEAFRRVLEAVASGILLKDGPGLLDPCEKTPVNAIAAMTNQQMEDLTANAQYLLRMLAMGRLEDILGLEKTSGIKNGVGQQQRKRPRDQDVEMADGDSNGGKKDKKEN